MVPVLVFKCNPLSLLPFTPLYFAKQDTRGLGEKRKDVQSPVSAIVSNRVILYLYRVLTLIPFCIFSSFPNRRKKANRVGRRPFLGLPKWLPHVMTSEELGFVIPLYAQHKPTEFVLAFLIKVKHLQLCL